jgi:hypothetical protein
LTPSHFNPHPTHFNPAFQTQKIDSQEQPKSTQNQSRSRSSAVGVGEVRVGADLGEVPVGLLDDVLVDGVAVRGAEVTDAGGSISLSAFVLLLPHLSLSAFVLVDGVAVRGAEVLSATHSQESAAPGRDRDNEVGWSLGSGADDDVVVSIGGTTLPVLKSDTERGRRKRWAGERNNEFF